MTLTNFHGINMKTRGKLYLIPSSLGNNVLNNVLPELNFNIIRKLEVFIVEDLRTARRFLRKAGYLKNFDEAKFYLLNKYTTPSEASTFLDDTGKNLDIGLVSEAGAPCIADPGADIVYLAHKKGIGVIPLTGPSSIMLALMGSGLNGQNFAFWGYLPVKANEREKKIRAIEKLSSTNKQTQIFIETPYRNMQMFQSLIKVCSDATRLSIACNLTTENAYIATKAIMEWKRISPDLHKKPAVFLIMA